MVQDSNHTIRDILGVGRHITGNGRLSEIAMTCRYRLSFKTDLGTLEIHIVFKSRV